MINRIQTTFERLKQHQRTGLVTFFVANDPTESDFRQLLVSLPEAGVDIIEIGMPFSDPVADGVAIQAAAQRAIAQATDLQGIFASVEHFRATNQNTPIVLMGYLNPILHMGEDVFFRRCAEVGVDGVILVDLPPEEEHAMRLLATDAGVDLIRLLTPTTSPERIAEITKHCSGFLYFVSVSGITGTKAVDIAQLGNRVAEVRKHSDLPVAVGFGIRDDDSAYQTAQLADAIVIGSMLVDYNHQLCQKGIRGTDLAQAVAARVGQFRLAIDQNKG